ncbi:MAG: molybdopterin cofactor-binding domain-containing protein [Acidobacteriota bacterium]
MSPDLEPDLSVEPERYELAEPPRYRFDLDRREFLAVTGAGLLILATQEAEAFQDPSSPDRNSVAARLHIGRNGQITLLTGKVEVGQGSRTQLGQAAAEELKVPLDRISLVMADTALVPDDGGTAGSRTTPSTVPAVRKAAAAAREILLELACQQWGLQRQSLQVTEGVVTHPVTRQTLSYAELANAGDAATRFRTAVPQDIQLTPVNRWAVLGQPVPKANGGDIVRGAHHYPSDVRRPGMLFGSVLRPSAYGATLAQVDLAPARQMPGVVVVHDGNFVGCAAPTSLNARQAVLALAETAVWRTKPQPSSRELFTHLKRNAVTGESSSRQPRVHQRGDLDSAWNAAHRTIQATYQVAYIQHAPLEPRAAVAEWEDGRLTVWTGTQQPQRVQSDLAQSFHLAPDRVRVIVPDTGGGFGGKHTGEAAVEAARLAKAAGVPVCLQWTREEEFTWAYFRPAALIEAKGGLDPDGRLLAWEFTNINSGASALASPYNIPHTREQFQYCDSPLREGSYRVLAATANNFARESFMDELASAAGSDPLEFRLAHLRNDRLRSVLQAVAERCGWKHRKRNQGMGLACGTEKGSYVAACVKVGIDRDGGGVQVKKIWQAFECGAIQNPDNLTAQVEGCIIMTLGGALSEEIHFENGRILNPRFSQYKVPRFKDVPPVETILINRPDLPSAGAGETPMIAVPPAISNAVFSATGLRIRSLPIRIPAA